MKSRIHLAVHREEIQKKVNDLGLGSLCLDELIKLDGDQIDDYISSQCKSKVSLDIWNKLKKTRLKIKRREAAQMFRGNAKAKNQELTKKLEQITREHKNLLYEMSSFREENRRLKIILGIPDLNDIESETESE